MKTIGKLTAGRKMQQLAVVVVCLTLGSIGWAAKVRIDQLARISDELEKDLTQPSEIYLWQTKQKARANPRQATSKLERKETPLPGAPISGAD